VATYLGVVGYSVTIYYKFAAEFAGATIFKTCEHLAKLQAHGHWGTVLVKDEEFAIDFM